MWDLSVFGAKQMEMLCQLRISSCLWRLFIFTILLNQRSGGSKARTTNVMSSNSAQGKMYSDTTLCDKVCQLFAAGWWFSPGPPLSSANKLDRHDIAEILLKVALNTNNSNLQMQVSNFHFNDIHNPRNLWSRVGISWFVLKISFHLLNSNFRGFHCYHQTTKCS